MTIRCSIVVASVLLLLASLTWAHDLFLKLDTYFLEPHARVRIPVLNGTFAESEGFVAPERIADASVVSPVGRTRLSTATAWSGGPDSTSLLSLELGEGDTRGGKTVAQRSTRTDSTGVAVVTLDAPGKWYVKVVHMVRATEPGLDDESKWATLTFDIR